MLRDYKPKVSSFPICFIIKEMEEAHPNLTKKKTHFLKNHRKIDTIQMIYIE